MFADVHSKKNETVLLETALQGTSQLVACQSSDDREAVLLIWTFYTQIFQQKVAASNQQDAGKQNKMNFSVAIRVGVHPALPHENDRKLKH